MSMNDPRTATQNRKNLRRWHLESPDTEIINKFAEPVCKKIIQEYERLKEQRKLEPTAGTASPDKP